MKTKGDGSDFELVDEKQRARLGHYFRRYLGDTLEVNECVRETLSRLAASVKNLRGGQAEFIAVLSMRIAYLLCVEREAERRSGAEVNSGGTSLCAWLPKSGDPPAEATSKAGRRRNVLAIMVKRDAALVKRLIDEEADDSDEASAAARAGTDFKIAYDFLKTEPNKSIKFAERSLRGGIPEGLYSLLLLLRQKDARAADALFLKAVDRLHNVKTVKEGMYARLMEASSVGRPVAEQSVRSLRGRGRRRQGGPGCCA